MFGTAFDNGWALLSPTVLDMEEFSTITHIWFSHEHPDHFSPLSLKKIPKQYIGNITVLFQNTTDRKVAEYCKTTGFKEIIEMEAGKSYTLGADFECRCDPFTYGDSWLYIKTQNYRILNVNDCVIDNHKDAEGIQAKIGGVDILLTQFGYANKVGNTADTALRNKASSEKLQRIGIQQQVFKPKTIIPFASFIYFCHEENKYMNDGINKINTVANYIENTLNTKAVVLYPGDVWDLSTEHNNRVSIDKYMADYAKLDAGEAAIVKQEKPVPIEDLIKESMAYAGKLNSAHGLANWYPPTYYWLTDYNKAFAFNLRKGLHEVNKTADSCDMALSSPSLFFSFKFLWGGDTLQINGRFQTPPNGDYSRTRLYYHLASEINRGESIPAIELLKNTSPGYYLRKVKQKLAAR